MKNHIIKTKLYFGAVVFLLILIVISGSSSLKNNVALSNDNIARLSQYYKYKMTIAQDRGMNLIASLGHVFGVKKNQDIIAKIEDKANTVPVLVYHGIVDNPDRFSMTAKQFKNQMLALKQDGYETITMADFVDYMNGNKVLPDKSFLLTFDDGRKDSYYGADPILKALGYNATMFIATSFSLPEDESKRSSYYLLEPELKSMIASGRWNVQSHAIQAGGGFVPIDGASPKPTMGNFLSNKMWLADKGRLETEVEYETRANKELFDSKQRIHSVLGVDVLSISYPFGDYGQQSVNNRSNSVGVISDIVSANYKVAFRQIWPVDSDYSHNYINDNTLYLKRIEPSPEWNGETLLSSINFGRSKALPYQDDFLFDQGWKNTWGNVEIKDNVLNLSSKETSSGSFSFLDGTYLWDNYIFNATIDWQKGSHAFLVSRFKDDLDYLTCTFSDDEIKINQIYNNRSTTLSSTKTNFILPRENVKLGVAVNKNTISCIVQGNIVLSYTGSFSELSHGGIGFKTWDKDEKGNTLLSIKKVEVYPIKNDLQVKLDLLEKTKLVEKQISGTPVNQTPKPAKNYPDINLPYKKNDFRDFTYDWKTLWGQQSIDETGLHFSSLQNTTGSSALLPGTIKWENYAYTVKADLVKGTSMGLIARATDLNNYLTCNFVNNYGRGYVKLEQVVNGKTTTLNRSNLQRLSSNFSYKWTDIPFGMNVNGNNITCLFNGVESVQYKLESGFTSGGIGVKTWDTSIGNSEAIIRIMEVLPL